MQTLKKISFYIILLILVQVGCTGSKVFVQGFVLSSNPDPQFSPNTPYFTTSSEEDGFTTLLSKNINFYGGKVIIIAKVTNEGDDVSGWNFIRLYRGTEKLDEARTWKPSIGPNHETTTLIYQGIFPPGLSTIILKGKSEVGTREAEPMLTKIIIEEIIE